MSPTQYYNSYKTKIPGFLNLIETPYTTSSSQSKIKIKTARRDKIPIQQNSESMKCSAMFHKCGDPMQIRQYSFIILPTDHRNIISISLLKQLRRLDLGKFNHSSSK